MQPKPDMEITTWDKIKAFSLLIVFGVPFVVIAFYLVFSIAAWTIGVAWIGVQNDVQAISTRFGPKAQEQTKTPRLFEDGCAADVASKTPWEYSRCNPNAISLDEEINNEEFIDSELLRLQHEDEINAILAGEEPGDCVIKGNISYTTGERIYHIPGDKYYNETIISPDFGERWFCTPAEAEAAGWRRAAE